MGCGESKQAVAIENTLTKSKSQCNNLPKNPPPVENENENVKENGKIPAADHANNKESPAGDGNENPSKKKDEKEKELEVVDDHGNKESEPVGKKIDDESDDAKKDEELKGGGGHKEEKMVNEETTELSPKKNDDEEAIESIISEGVSGKSDYYSPRANKGTVSSHGNDHAQEKDAEAKLNKEKVTEEVLNVDADHETKSSGEEKISAETPNAASTTDVKAN